MSFLLKVLNTRSFSISIHAYYIKSQNYITKEKFTDAVQGCMVIVQNSPSQAHQEMEFRLLHISLGVEDQGCTFIKSPPPYLPALLKQLQLRRQLQRVRTYIHEKKIQNTHEKNLNLWGASEKGTSVNFTSQLNGEWSKGCKAKRFLSFGVHTAKKNYLRPNRKSA